MSVPKTLGKMCTNLADMEIGDYIPCVYESSYFHEIYYNYFHTNAQESRNKSYYYGNPNNIKNIVGFFSQLGIKKPCIKTVIHTVIDGVKQQDTIEKLEYDEIDFKTTTSQILDPTIGIFYLIKVDRGKLIADRSLIYSDFIELNSTNYINGGFYQVTKARTKKVIDIDITNKTYDSTDTAKNEIVYDDSEFRTKKIEKFVQTKVEVGNASTPTKITVTTVTIYFAYYDDDPKPTITSVVNPDYLTIKNSENNLDLLKSKLEENVPTVEVDILDVDGETTSTKSMNVTWDISTFDTSLDEQTIYGYLEDKENDEEDSISNPDGIRAELKIINDGTEEVDKCTIIPPPILEIYNIQPTEDRIKRLIQESTKYQQVTLNILNDDGTITSKTANVEWDLSTFDYDNFEHIYQQTIYGRFTDSEFSNIKTKPYLITTPASCFTKLKLKKYGIEQYTSFAFKFGTDRDYIINYLNSNLNPKKNSSLKRKFFSTSVSIGAYATTKFIDLNVTWNDIIFEENKSGVQKVYSDKFPEIIERDDRDYNRLTDVPYYLVNSDDIRVPSNITIYNKGNVNSFNDISISVSLGTNKSEILSKLGTTIIANTTEDCFNSADNKTSEIFNVEWDLSSLDVNKAGTANINGTIISEDKDNYSFSVQPSATITIE